MKTAIIWSAPGCVKCEEVKAKLKEDGYDITVKDANDIESEEDIEARTQLCMQNMALPVVKINGEFVDIM